MDNKRLSQKNLTNKKAVVIVLLFLVTAIFISSCGNQNKSAYGYWSGVDSRGEVTYDIHVTKNHIVILEDKGATKYKYKNEKIGVRNTMVISGKELARHIDGLDDATNSSALFSLVDDDKDHPFLAVLINTEGTLSDAKLYPIDKSDSPLSRVEGSGGSWFMLIIPIGLFLYLFRKRTRAR